MHSSGDGAFCSSTDEMRSEKELAADASMDRAKHLYRIVKAFSGDRVEVLHLLDAGVKGVLYEAFVFEISYGERYGNLEAGIVLPGGRVMTAPFAVP